MFKKKRILLAGLLSIFLFVGIAEADHHYVPYRTWWLVPLQWTRGCSPTSAAMILNYWDKRDLSGFGPTQYFGRLTSYWANHWDNEMNVPMPLIDQLHQAMKTDGDGGTDPWNIGSGIKSVANDYNGYSFEVSTVIGSPIPGTDGWDFCWGAMKEEIDNGKPFVWSVSAMDGTHVVGHSLCAFGYTDSKYVITYNTWDTGEDCWYYNQYDNGNPILPADQIDRIHPGGGDHSEVRLMDPYADDIITGDSTYEIWWHEYGTSIAKVNIYFSSDSGKSWTFIGSQGSNMGFYDWHVPNIQTISARIQIEAFDASGKYIAGEGSIRNFCIKCTSPLPPGALSYPVADCDGNFTVSWTSSLTSSYELQMARDSNFTNPITVFTGNANSWNQTGLSRGPCYYRVRAADDCTPGNWSGWTTGGEIYVGVSGTPRTLAVPSSDCDGNVDISWNAVDDATSYELQGALDSQFKSAMTIYKGSDTFFRLTGVPQGDYYARVRASTSCGWSGWRSAGPIHIGLPERPSTISYPSLSCDGNFIVNWNSVAEASFYELQRATTSGFADAVTVYSGASTNWSQTGLGVGAYYFRVRATTGCGTSSWRTGAALVRGGPLLSPPPISYPSSDDDGSFIINWSPTTGATSYELQRAANIDFSGARSLYSGPTTTWNESVPNSGIYYYRVRATNGCATSGWMSGGPCVVNIMSTTFLIPFGSLDNGNLNIANLGNATANLTIKILDAGGTSIKDQMTTIPPKGVGKTWDLIGNIFSYGKPLSVEITGDKLLAGDNIKWAGPPYETVGAGFTCGPESLMKGKLFFYPFSAFGQSNSYVVISNVTTVAANMTIEIFDRDGVLKKTSSFTVGPRGVARSWEHVGSIQAVADPALLKITSDQDVVMEAVRWELNKRGWGFAIFPSVISSGMNFLIPFGALDNGNINLSNIGGSTANLTLKVVNSSGAVVKLQDLTIPVRGVRRSWDAIGNIYQYGKPVSVEVTSDQALAADNIKWASPPNDTVGAGFTCGPLSLMKGKEFYFPFSSFGQSNGYAVISNATLSTANLTIEVYDQAGALKKTKAFSIGPRGIARSWEQIGSIQAIADPALIKITSDQDVVVEAVRLEQNKRGWGFAILPVQ
jgi:hypothetical protein